MKKNPKSALFSTAFTLSGTIIGAGILGLPYVFSQSGIIIGLLWILFFGVVMTLNYLYLGETILRTKERHQLPGLAQKYLGKRGEYFMLFAMLYGMYSSLLAYLIGEGESLSQLFLGTTSHSIFFTIGFWVILTILLEGGIDRLKKVETYGVGAIMILVLGIFIYFFGDIQVSNLTYVTPGNLFLPLGVTMFALLGFSSIPELREEIKGHEKKLKKAIILGTTLPIILYTIFTVTLVGVMGAEIDEIATLSFGPFMTILGIFTMLTSYFVLSFGIKDIFLYDLKMKKGEAFLWATCFPMFLFIILYFLQWNNFIMIIGIGGVISGGLTGILAILMNYKAKKLNERKPEYSIKINKTIIGIIILIFITGVGLQLYNTFG